MAGVAITVDAAIKGETCESCKAERPATTPYSASYHFRTEDGRMFLVCRTHAVGLLSLLVKAP